MANCHRRALFRMYCRSGLGLFRRPSVARSLTEMSSGKIVAQEHFQRGVELFNRGDFFEAHEEMEEAMNALEENDDSDFEFYLGVLRAAVANHKLSQGLISGAILHLKAALKFLAPYPGEHHGIRLEEFRAALAEQRTSLEKFESEGGPAPSKTPMIEHV